MEKWEQVKDFPNHYISDKGRLWSYETSEKGREIKGHIDDKGYRRFKLGHKKVQKSKKAHRLVAEAFIQNDDNYPQVNHKDGDKDNNTVLNLEWCDNAGNMRHAVENNLIKSKLENHVHARLTNDDVLKIRDLHKRNFNQIELSEMFKIDRSAISRIVNNKSWNLEG